LKHERKVLAPDRGELCIAAGQRLPHTTTLPELGRTSPASMEMSVVFPDPEGPINRTSSPGPMASETRFTTVASSEPLRKDFSSAVAAINGSSCAGGAAAGK
jgi:hypothetical protein